MSKNRPKSTILKGHPNKGVGRAELHKRGRIHSWINKGQATKTKSLGNKLGYGHRSRVNNEKLHGTKLYQPEGGAGLMYSILLGWISG